MIVTEKENLNKSESLYTLTEQYRDALENVSINEEDGEIMGLDAVNAIGDSVEEKAVACIHFVENRQILIDAIEAKIKTLQARAKTLKNINEHIKCSVLNAMIATKIKRVITDDIVVSTRKSKSVEVYDEGLLTEDMFTVKTTKTVSKTAIKKAIDAGQDVQGARIVEKLTLQVK